MKGAFMTKKPMLRKSQRRRGQGSVEYILIIAVIVGVIVAFGKQFKSKIGEVTDNLFKNVNSSVTDLTH